MDTQLVQHLVTATRNPTQKSWQVVFGDFSTWQRGVSFFKWFVDSKLIHYADANPVIPLINPLERMDVSPNNLVKYDDQMKACKIEWQQHQDEDSKTIQDQLDHFLASKVKDTLRSTTKYGIQRMYKGEFMKYIHYLMDIQTQI